MHITCSPTLLTMYGPFAINVYGFFIALGILVCMVLIPYNKRYGLLHLHEKFTDIILVSIIAGIFGGRLLAIISEPLMYNTWAEWFMLWQGGFSALGSILGVVMITPLYLRKIHLPILPIFDLVAIYAPLFQSIARLGCLFAGCCHGITTAHMFAVIYTHPETIALYNVPVHPTQLYSSILLLCIFFCMFFVVQHRAKQPGTIFLTYLMLAASERFIIDFWRADRIMYTDSFLSFHQYVALVIITVALMLHGKINK